jgi:hypothetical protein
VLGSYVCARMTMITRSLYPEYSVVADNTSVDVIQRLEVRLCV